MRISWKDVKFYLAGPMEYVQDSGVSWREDLEKILKSVGFSEKNILNPTNKPRVDGSLPLSQEVALTNSYRENKDWDGLHLLMKRIMTVDLRLVDHSDIVIAWAPSKYRMTGTIHEIISARNQKKPVILVCGSGIEAVSSWLIGLVGPWRIFSSNQKAIEYIQSIRINGPYHPKDKKEFVIFDFDNRDSNGKN